MSYFCPTYFPIGIIPPKILRLIGDVLWIFMSGERISTINDIAAPPPPPLPTFTTRVTEERVQNKCEESKEVIIYNLKESIKRSLKINSLENIKFSYSHTEAIIQEGPTCGLVALAIVASTVPCIVSVKEIFELAKDIGYSKKGEMFSAFNMSQLAERILSKWFEITVFSDGMKDNKTEILENLHKGCLYMVPYDADKNHSPGLFGGHKAHWAVLLGAVEHDSSTLILARQGKSKQVGVWDFSSLCESNNNLFEVSSDRTKEGEFVVDNIANSLSRKFILFKYI